MLPMASFSTWIHGARLQTLPASISPIFAGIGVTLWLDTFDVFLSILCVLAGLTIQLAVNYSNDYSDGIRGTDKNRIGPARLTGGDLAHPYTVLAVAIGFYGLTAALGLIIIAFSGQWWLILVGVAAIAAGWFYTGGKHPYGYMGLGEVFVFVFFGLVACGGTIFVQAGGVPLLGWLSSCIMGLVACCILMLNNIRDIPTDTYAGKKTLAVRMGDNRARIAYSITLIFAMSMCFGLCFTPNIHTWCAVFFLPSLVFVAINIARILGIGQPAAHGGSINKLVKLSGLTELTMGLALLATFWVSANLV